MGAQCPLLAILRLRSMKPAYPRLQILMAQDTRVGLVIRHGPPKSVCTMRWDRSRDKFVLGQWMRGRIDTETCNLSPNGDFFLYTARKNSAIHWRVIAWTAVSRVPYLKAIAYYPHRGEGGWFLSDSEYCIPGGWREEEDREHPAIRRVESVSPKPSLYSARMEDHGWSIEDTTAKFAGHIEFVRQAGSGWELRHRQGQGYRLIRGELAADTRDWEWADMDDKRLVWTAKGCLWAAVMHKNGIQQSRVLHDFNGMKFEALAAPYEEGWPVDPMKPVPPQAPVIARAKRRGPPKNKKPNRSKPRPHEDP
jgi:hypothetical protein